MYYGLHLYLSGLSLRKGSERLSQMYKRNHVLLAKKQNWIQKYHPQRILSKRKRTLEYILDETLIKVGSNYVWIWIAIGPENRQIHALSISKERNMLITERFIGGLVKNYGTSCINGWWYLVSAGLQIPQILSSSSFLLREKHNRELCSTFSTLSRELKVSMTIFHAS